MLKEIGQHSLVQTILGYLAERYLAFVRLTTRFVVEPGDFPATIGRELPVIAAMWHGQHFMVHYAWPKGARVGALISRHRDGEFNAVMLRRIGVIPVRGSGGGVGKKVKRGGFAAMREMLREIAGGTTMVLTADVPKVARKAGLGIVTLAQLAGRPIYPIAVVSRNRIDLSSWDRASFPLPFGRGAMVLGAPVHVDRQASAEQLELLRQQVEDGLNAAHKRAFALVGAKDPGRSLNSMAVP